MPALTSPIRISTTYRLPSFGTATPAMSGGNWGPYPDSVTAATKLYVPLIQIADPGIIGMYSSTDEGETWSLEDTWDIGGTDIIEDYAGWVDGTLIRMTFWMEEAGGDSGIHYREYNMSTDVFQASATIPTVALPPITSLNRGANITQVNGIVLVGYADGANARYLRIATGGSSWSGNSVEPTRNSTPFFVPSVGSSLRAHVIYRELTTYYVRTLNTSGFTFTTELDQTVTNARGSNSQAESGILGNDGGADLFGTAMAITVSLVQDPRLRRLEEDGSGDATLTGASFITIPETNASDFNVAAAWIIDPDTDDIWYYYVDNSEIDTMRCISTNTGASFSGLTKVVDGTGADAMVRFSIKYYKHNTSLDRVVGMVAAEDNEGDQPWYGEDIIEVGAIVESEIRPIADTAAAGWDSAPTGSQALWQQIDEATFSDTDYMFAEDPNP